MKRLLTTLSLVVWASTAEAYDYGSPAPRIVVCDYGAAEALFTLYEDTEDATLLWNLQNEFFSSGECAYFRYPFWIPMQELDFYEGLDGDTLTFFTVTDGSGGIGYSITFEPIFLGTPD